MIILVFAGRSLGGLCGALFAAAGLEPAEPAEAASLLTRHDPRSGNTGYLLTRVSRTRGTC